MTDNSPAVPEKASQKKASVAKVRLATGYPYVSFDPGDGLAAVTADGTEYTPEDAARVKDRAFVASLKQGFPIPITEVE